MKRILLAAGAAIVLLGIGLGSYYVATMPGAEGGGRLNTKNTAVRDGEIVASINVQSAAGERARAAASDSRIIAAGDESIKVYNTSGKELYSEANSLNNPVIDTAGNFAIVADQGGRAITLLDGEKCLYSIKLETDIITAKVNKNGMAVVVTTGELHKNAVLVLNKKGSQIFKWNSGGLYVIDADISDNGRDIAVSTLDTNVAVIKAAFYLFNINKDTPTASASFDDSIISNIICSKGNIYCISDSKMVIYNAGGGKSGEVEFADRQLTAFAVSGSQAVLAFTAGDYGINSHGTALEIYNVKGELSAQAELESDLTFLAYRDGTLVAGDSGQISVFNAKCVKQYELELAGDVKSLYLMKDATYGVAVTNASTDVIAVR